MTSLRLASIYVALFLSGAAALVYQATWGRMLHRVFGVSDYAVASVLAAFFLGLGLGSALGGRWARRIRRPAIAYALLEGGIGVYALASLFLIPRVHDLYAALGEDASLGELTVVRLLLALLILLPPTLLMGATLPVLVAVIAEREGGWSSPATFMYATNTLGATAGAGLTGLFLVPELGARMTISLAAAASLVGALLVLAFWFRPGARPSAPPPEAAPTEPARPAVKPLAGRPGLAVVLAALAGTAALASEVLWTRVLRMIVQGTTQAFSAMLVNYLIGIALGSLLADRIAKRARSPAHLFGTTQVLLAILTAVAMAVTPQLPRLIVLVQKDLDMNPHDAGVILLVSSVLLFPLALVLGTSVPLAWKIAGEGAAEAPKHAGRVLAWNTLGGLVGSLMAGFILVPIVGVEIALLGVMFLHLLSSVIAFRSVVSARLVPRVLSITGPLALGVGILLLGPSVQIPYLLDARHNPMAALVRGPDASWRDPVQFLEEGRNTTVSILNRDNALRLYNDGRPESGIGMRDPGYGVELALLGGLPTLFARDPERAMVIGLGAGHTTTVLLAGPWERIDVIELEEAVVDAARLLHERREKPFPLDDPRARLIVDDARARLVLAEPGTYDAIVSQPSHPWLAGSSALYTREFFEEAKRALRPGGVVIIWLNLFRMEVVHVRSVVATLRSVFPETHAFVADATSIVFAGALEPIPDGEEIDLRIGRHLRPILDSFNLASAVDLSSIREMDPASAEVFAEGAELIVDDRPVLEFELARLPSASRVVPADIDRALAAVPWMSRPSFDALPDGQEVDALLDRIEQVETRRIALVRLELSLPRVELSEDDRGLVGGALAEARGSLSGALAAYDRSSSGEAAFRADRLRHAERMHGGLLQAAREREAIPATSYYLLSSAIAIGRPEEIAEGIALAGRVPGGEEEPLYQVATAFASGGCPGALAAPATSTQAAEDEHVAFLAERCAIEAGRLRQAREFAELRMRVRRQISVQESSLAQEALASGNGGGAFRHYRRALSANPAHGVAAGALARMLDRQGRRDEAEQILRRGLVAARGLPSSTAAVRAAAAELSIPLPADDAAGEAASPTATEPPQMTTDGEEAP